jgi:thiamine biosynthesis lipoprotein
VNAGGDIFVQSKQAVDIAVQHPRNPELAIGTAHIMNQAICGSSMYRRQWGDYHHIINPKTSKSPTHIQALWVVSDTTMLSDILSTALFFVDPKVLLKAYNFEYVIVYNDDSVVYSENFPGTIFE